jgi:hypothetical protein
MADAHNKIHQFAALPCVHHPVVAYPQAPHAFEFTLERRARSRSALG